MEAFEVILDILNELIVDKAFNKKITFIFLHFQRENEQNLVLSAKKYCSSFIFFAKKIFFFILRL